MTSKTELNEVMNTLKKLYTKQAKLTEAISKQESIIKEYLTAHNLTNITLENGSASWKEVLQKGLDMKAFRQTYENIYQMFAVQKVTKRFKVA